MAAKIGLLSLGLALALAPATNLLAEQAAPDAKPAATPAPAAPAASAPASGDAAKLAKGRELFENWSCGTCHALKDGGGSGHVGPSLDGNANLTQAFIVDRVTNGQGAMPAFGGQMTDAEIAEIAAYITQVAAK